MIAVKLQMEADITYARSIYKKFAKDRENLVELLGEKEKKNFFRLDSQRSDLPSARSGRSGGKSSSSLIRIQNLGGGSQTGSKHQTPTKSKNSSAKKDGRKKNKELYQHLKEYFMKQLSKDDSSVQSENIPPPKHSNIKTKTDFKTKYFGKSDQKTNSPIQSGAASKKLDFN